MNWILNRKIIQPGLFLGSILVMVVEMSLLNVCVLLFRIAVTSRKTDWYSSAVKLEVAADVFASDRGNAVFAAMTAAVLAVFIFLFVSFWMFRRFQLEKMSSEIGIYSALGYGEEKIRGLLRMDIIIDSIITIPFAVYTSLYMLKILNQRDEFKVMLSSIHPDAFMLVIQYLFCLLFMYLFMEICQKLWMDGKLKKQLCMMIKEKE